MSESGRLKGFLFPSLTPKYLIRVAVIAAAAYLIFGHVITPMRLQGRSMEPTYKDGAVNFCFRLRYLFSEPERYDVVAVRFTGKRWMLLKRVVALEGETGAFENGVLLVNGAPLDEPYLKYPCNWNLEARTVGKNNVYLVGDNRNVPMAMHDFGQTPVRRIVGAPLW